MNKKLDKKDAKDTKIEKQENSIRKTAEKQKAPCGANCFSGFYATRETSDSVTSVRT
jgi:hypothetical protein